MRLYQVDVDFTVTKRIYMEAECTEQARALVEEECKNNPNQFVLKNDACVGIEVTGVSECDQEVAEEPKKLWWTEKIEAVVKAAKEGRLQIDRIKEGKMMGYVFWTGRGKLRERLGRFKRLDVESEPANVIFSTPNRKKEYAVDIYTLKEKSLNKLYRCIVPEKEE